MSHWRCVHQLARLGMFIGSRHLTAALLQDPRVILPSFPRDIVPQLTFVLAFCFFCLIGCSTTYRSVFPSNVTAIAAPSSTTLNVDQSSRPVKLRAYYRVQPASRQPGRILYAGPWTDIRHIKQQCRQPSCQVPPPYNDFVLQHCQGCTARQRHIITSAKANAITNMLLPAFTAALLGASSVAGWGTIVVRRRWPAHCQGARCSDHCCAGPNLYWQAMHWSHP